MPFNTNPQAAITDPDKLHALSAGLMAGEQNGFYTNSLTTGVARKALRKILSDNHIKDTAQLHSLLYFLKEEGQRSAYDIMLPLFLSHSEEKEREAAIGKKFAGIELLMRYCVNLHASLLYTRLNSNIRITDEDLRRGILAWDMGNIIKLVRTAYDCRLIDEKEAWENIEFSAKKCRECFASWEETGKSYLLGQAVNHPGEEAFKKTVDCYRLATEGAGSPWLSTSFGGAISSSPPHNPSMRQAQP